MALNNSDLILVNRSGVSYSISASDLMANLEDTDLLLVNRNGVSYKATGEEFKDFFGSSLISLSYLVIGAGGGGGGSNGGGGGGAGGYLTNTNPGDAQAFVDQSALIDVSIGVISSNGNDGDPSTISTSATATSPGFSYKAWGGGKGGAAGNGGNDGGSGGGGGTTVTTSKDTLPLAGSQSSQAIADNNTGSYGVAGSPCQPRSVSLCAQYGAGFWCQCVGPGDGGGGGGAGGGASGTSGGSGLTTNFTGTSETNAKGGPATGTQSAGGYGNGSSATGNDADDGVVYFLVDPQYTMTVHSGSLTSQSGTYNNLKWYRITAGTGQVYFS